MTKHATPTQLHKTMMMSKLNKAYASSPWMCEPVDEGEDMIGQRVRIDDVVMTVIDDKMVLMRVIGISLDEFWKSNPSMRHGFTLVRYKSKRKPVRVQRNSWGVFKVGPEHIASAVLSGRLQ